MSVFQNLANRLSRLSAPVFTATKGGAWPFGKLRLRRASAQGASRSGEPLRLTSSDARVPFLREDPDLAERNVIASHIARLMLADEWMAIADQIADWEARLAATPGGQRYHDIALQVALSGLEALIDDVPRDTLAHLDPSETELSHFLDAYRRSPGNHVLAVMAARAHLMLGEACRADHWPGADRREAWRRMAHHFVMAGDILAEYDALANMSPLIAEAHYLQALGSPGGRQKLPELFRNWIDLDPSNPAIYTRHADWLARTDLVTDQAILDEADRALDRTEKVLGFGGYALFFMPLLEIRDGARQLVDAELFAAAMLDLAALPASQAEVNWAANALACEVGAAGAGQPPALRDALYLLIRSRITALYPRLWHYSEDALAALFAEAAAALPDVMPEADTSAGMAFPRAA